MINQRLDEHTFLMLAMHHYDNSQCVNIAEFEEDLKRFTYLKKLLARYEECGELKDRLIINHLTVLYNLFGIVTTDLLFYKIDQQYWTTLTTFLVFLDKMPESIPEYGIVTSEIKLDDVINNVLRTL